MARIPVMGLLLPLFACGQGERWETQAPPAPGAKVVPVNPSADERSRRGREDPGRERKEPDGGNDPGTGRDPLVPSYPGAVIHPLDGRLAVEGRPTSVSIFQTPDSPEQVIAFFRKGFQSLPWDWVEIPVPGGLLLGVHDNREGRRLAIEATRHGTSTQVTWGWSSPGRQGPDEASPAHFLPREIVWLGRVDDSLGNVTHSTHVGASPLGHTELETASRLSLERSGWSRTGDSVWKKDQREARVQVQPLASGSRIEVQVERREDR